MSPLARVNPRAIGQIAGYLDRLDDPKAVAELAVFTRDALPAKTWRDFHRLLGFAEALVLDQEPGAAIYVYQELIALIRTCHRSSPCSFAIRPGCNWNCGKTTG